ncbi:MAG: hypothetical protein ABSB50_14450 [Terracidiphilus sp.]|jgi:hypothetical protein
MSEFLREKHRQGEITQQQNGDDETDRADDFKMHGLPQLLARLDVEERQGEENRGEQHHHDILHSGSPCFIQISACETSLGFPRALRRSSFSAGIALSGRNPAQGPANRPDRI